MNPEELLYRKKKRSDGKTYYYDKIQVDSPIIESMENTEELYQQKMGSDGKKYYEQIPIESLTIESLKENKLRGGAGELGFKYFYQKNKEYVKKWKEVLVNRQLFEMWHALTPKEQKVWIDKATRFDKLFAMTNNLVSLKYPDTFLNENNYLEITKDRIYPKKETSNFGYKSGYEYFMDVSRKFNIFFNRQVRLNPTLNYTQQFAGPADPKYTDPAFLKQVVDLWKESIMYPIFEYSLYPSWEQLSKEGRQEWHDALDALEHAYDMFCENSKITNPQMRVTNSDVKDHLSRMWEAMDRESQNTWNYSAGDTLPIRHRGVRGLDGDFEEEYLEEDNE